MTLILSPMPFPDQEQEPLAGGSYNGGNYRPPVAAGQADSNDNAPELFANIAITVARTLNKLHQEHRGGQQ